PCTQGSPLTFQPPRLPLWRLGSSGPSNPSAPFRQRVYPAAAIARAALRLRPPERHRKNSSVSLLAPNLVSASVSWATKVWLGVLPGKSSHSTSTGRFPTDARSGRPTKAHSALVLTSTKTEP